MIAMQALRYTRRRRGETAARSRARELAAVCSALTALSCNAILGIEDVGLTCATPTCTNEAVPAPEVGQEGLTDAGVTRNPAQGMDPALGLGGAGGGAGASSGIDRPPVSGPVVDPSSAPDAGANPPEPGPSGTGGMNSSNGGGGAGGEIGEPPGAGGGLPGPLPGDVGLEVLCNTGDACGECLCSACPDEIARCAATPGCAEILACARVNACFGFECYCGSMNLIACVTSGQGNGACRDISLEAPGSHPPTPLNPNAGPASEAALNVANCQAQSGQCDESCPN